MAGCFYSHLFKHKIGLRWRCRLFFYPGKLVSEISNSYILIIPGFFIALCFFSSDYYKKQTGKPIQMHPELLSLQHFDVPDIKCIAVALDFSGHDEKLIAHAIKQGGKNVKYILIHVVESASAYILGKQSDDYETPGADRLSRWFWNHG